MSRTFHIPTLDFIPLEADCLRDLLADPAAFLKGIGAQATVKEAVVEIAHATQALHARLAAAYPWIGYLVQEPDRGVLVGTCAYKGGPTAEGVVEIAYHTFPEFKDHGYATAMAQELLAQAFCHAEVNRVIAYTAPAVSASTRVLEKVGLVRTGDFDHPEDGPVWRWALSR